METLLFVVLSLWLTVGALKGVPVWTLGLLGGLVTLTRVEGALLVALVWLWAWRRWSGRERIVMLAVCGIVIAPMLLTNWLIGGTFLPNTWSAKSAGVHQPGAGLLFALEYSLMLLIGLNVLNLPALLYLVKGTRDEKMVFALPLLWCLILLLTYVITLPVSYHHLRYMMPSLPWLILLGVAGVARLYRETHAVGGLQIGLTSVFAMGLALFGMNVYGWNVQNVQAQHVAVGKWLNRNTSETARVAADDIGAIGYFSGRFIVDLYGLVTPEIVPTLRAQMPLESFLCAHAVDYIAVFPHTHPELRETLDLEEVYRAHLQFNTITPNADMIVEKVGGCERVP
jgi:hypothetical protein